MQEVEPLVSVTVFPTATGSGGNIYASLFHQIMVAVA